MPSSRPPWWLYSIAALFVFYLGIYVYCALFGPQDPGFLPATQEGCMVVGALTPNSPAARAGLERGDYLVSVDDIPVRNAFDWGVVGANLEVGRPHRVLFTRHGEQRALSLVLERSLTRDWGWFEWFTLINRVVIMFLAAVIAFGRPNDLAARVGAVLLAGVAVSRVLPIDGLAVVWRSLPAPLGALLWIPAVGAAAVPGSLFTFCAVFPRKLFRSKLAWALAWTPLLLLILWILPRLYWMIYQPLRVGGMPAVFVPATAGVYFAYVLAASAALVLNYRRLEDVNERRRVRALVFGSVVGWLAIMPNALLLLLGGSAASAYLASPLGMLPVLLFLAFPLSFAYAILRHRLFDIRVMLRQGLQYALARHLVFSLVPFFAGVLILDLVWHGDQPLLAILRQRGWIYLALGALAATAHFQRQSWMDALDRRFFRERYDAQRLLRDVAEEVRTARSFENVGPRVVARIEEALHPEFVALLVREPGAPAFRCLTAAPAANAPPPLLAESKLIGLVRLLGKPLEVPRSESGWLQQQLPHEETEFLRRARMDLIVPVSSQTARCEVLLVLGVKRSEEPYSREDQDLLQAISSSLAILLEKPAAPASRPADLADSAFEECSQCGAVFDSGTGRCSLEGALLARTLLPRTLAGRYHLEKRLGRGGMGTVYAATDTALERRVAVKVIRDDLIGSADAADRFRREAKAAASFAHPNVVTVHDFGVAADTRAFLVMELLVGSSLREELQREKRLAPARVLDILRGACAAVDAAHRRNLIHRDLKPENIFLARTESGELPKVLDFGVAKFLPAESQATQATRDADTGAGQLVGTFRYMSPEQLSAQPVDPYWDLWSLGVVAYEMLAGAHPFAGETSLDLHRAMLAGNFTPLSTHLPSAPARWQEFFVKSFSRDKHLRPASASAFFSALEDAFSQS